MRVGNQNIQKIRFLSLQTVVNGGFDLTFSNCMHLETDCDQVVVVENFAAVEYKSWFYHGSVNSFVIQFLKHTTVILDTPADKRIFKDTVRLVRAVTSNSN